MAQPRKRPSKNLLVTIPANLDSLMDEYTSRLEEKVAAESQYFQLMANAMPQVVWTAEPGGEMDYFNQRWYDLTGLSEKESMKKGWLAVAHPDDAKKAKSLWAASLKTGKLFEAELRFKTRYGNDYIWFLTRALLGKNSSGEPVKWFGTCTDIDEHKKYQERQETLVAMASHELKTPLTSARIFLDIIKRHTRRTAKDLKLTEYVSAVSGSVDRLTKLLDDLIEVNRVQSSRLKLNKTLIDVDELVRETVKDLQLTTEDIRLRIASLCGKKTNADAIRIRQVLVNLLTNAVNHAPAGSEILIGSKIKGKQILIKVQNFGDSIAKEDQEKIFESFYQSPSSKSKSGLGLGLYIARKIVELHGGRIWVESSRGKGASFIFTLPVKN